MHYDVAEVEEHPPRVGCSFAAVAPDAGLAQGLFDRVADSLELALAVGAAENKIVGDIRHSPDIQHQDISSLLVECSLHGLLGYLR